MIKLPEEATEEQHLELLAVLNSSTACFWLKQVSHDKAGMDDDGGGGNARCTTWERSYEFTGTKLEQFPLPAALPLNRGRTLDALARELDAVSPRAVVAVSVAEPSGTLAQQLKEAEATAARLRERMIFEQEELDWEVYRLYGLLDDDLTYSGDVLAGGADWRSTGSTLLDDDLTYSRRRASTSSRSASGRSRSRSPARSRRARRRPPGSPATAPPRSPSCRRAGPPTTPRSCSVGST